MLVAGHRWPALTRALVADVHAHGRTRCSACTIARSRASREHLIALGVDAVVESDAGPDAFVRAIVTSPGAAANAPSARVAHRVARGPARDGRRSARASGGPRSRSSWRRRSAAGRASCSSMPTTSRPRSRSGCICRSNRTCGPRSTRSSTVAGDLDGCVIAEPASAPARRHRVAERERVGAGATGRDRSCRRSARRRDADVVVADGAGIARGRRRGRRSRARSRPRARSSSEADVARRGLRRRRRTASRACSAWAVEARRACAPEHAVVVVVESCARRAVPRAASCTRRSRRAFRSSTSCSFRPTGGCVDAAWNGTAVGTGRVHARGRRVARRGRRAAARVADDRVAARRRRDRPHRRVRRHPARRAHGHRAAAVATGARRSARCASRSSARSTTINGGRALGDEVPLGDPPEMAQRVLRSITELGPLSELLARRDVEEVFVEGARVTYLDTDGRLRGLAEPTTEEENRQIVDRLLAATERQLNAKHPLVQARVLDGTARLTAAIAPVADRLSATVRRYTVRDVTLDDARRARRAERAGRRLPRGRSMQLRSRVAVSGEPGAGKTTLRGRAARRPSRPRTACGAARRSASSRCRSLHGGYYEVRPAGLDGTGEISLRDLVKFVLAMRPGPDRRRRGARRRGVRADPGDQRRLRVPVHAPRQQRARCGQRARQRGADGGRERDRADRPPDLRRGARSRRAPRPRRRRRGATGTCAGRSPRSRRSFRA